mgnify:CR=1 FL=1
MSETDSFIDEVTEEVRRDELFGYFRRYGWIALALVLLLVGGAAYNEYRKAQTTAAAQDAGDQLLAALGNDNPADRVTALAGIAVDGPADTVVRLTNAAILQEAGDIDGARAALDAVALDAELPDLYRDLAAFKAAMLPSEDAAARMSALEALAQPGATFALLAQEQLALLHVDAGDTDAAIAALKDIAANAETTRGLRQRAQTMIVALGGSLEAAETSQ